MRGGFFFVGWREPAKLSHSSRHDFESGINFLRCCVAAKAEADTRARFIRGKANRCEHVRGFDSSRGASRTGGAGQALEIEGNDQGFAFDSAESNVRSVGGTRRFRSVGTHIGNAGKQTLLESIA